MQMPRRSTGPTPPAQDNDLRKGRQSLARYIRARRDELGLSALELADRADLPPAYINALESGRIGLPGVERRRQLAQALGVAHVDFLIAAGELREDELPSPGARQSYDLYPQLHRAIDNMTPDTADALQDLIYFVATAPDLAATLNASATRGRWMAEMRNIRNRASRARGADAAE